MLPLAGIYIFSFLCALAHSFTSRTRRPPQGNTLRSPNQFTAPAQTFSSSTSSTPLWQHQRQEKRRSFSFLYMTDSPLDVAAEEDESEHFIPQSLYRKEVPAPALTPAPTPTSILPRNRRSSYASTTAAKRVPKHFQEIPSPDNMSTPEHERKRKQNIFHRLFHRKGK
jgi:hypothetical protein